MFEPASLETEVNNKHVSSRKQVFARKCEIDFSYDYFKNRLLQQKVYFWRFCPKLGQNRCIKLSNKLNINTKVTKKITIMIPEIMRAQ